MQIKKIVLPLKYQITTTMKELLPKTLTYLTVIFLTIIITMYSGMFLRTSLWFVAILVGIILITITFTNSYRLENKLEQLINKPKQTKQTKHEKTKPITNLDKIVKH